MCIYFYLADPVHIVRVGVGREKRTCDWLGFTKIKQYICETVIDGGQQVKRLWLGFVQIIYCPGYFTSPRIRRWKPSGSGSMHC